MNSIKKIDKLIREELNEVYSSINYYGDQHNLQMQPYLHTMDKIKKMVEGLSNDISSDLASGAVDIIVLKRTIFGLLDDLIRAITYEKTKLEGQLGDERGDEDE